MKRIIFWMLLCVSLKGFAEIAYQTTTNEDGTLAITGYTGTLPSSLILPEAVNGMPVTEVAANVFNNSSELVSVAIPDSIQRIRQFNFSHCANLMVVQLGKGLIEIEALQEGRADFLINCPKLTAIVVAEDNPVFSANGTLLYNKDKSEIYFGRKSGEYVISETVVRIAPFAFQGSLLTKLVIPNAVESIGVCAFSDCTMLETVTLGLGIKSISSSVFMNTPWYTNWLNEQNDGLLILGSCVVGVKGEISTVVIPEGIYEIGASAFLDNTTLTTLVLADSVEVVGMSAFERCANLQEVRFGSGLTTIGDYGFFNCQNLSKFVLPASVTQIGTSIIGNCTKLTSFSVADENPNFTAIANCLCTKDGSKLLSVPVSVGELRVPEGITVIAREALFSEFLTSLMLPESLTTIEEAGIGGDVNTILFKGAPPVNATQFSFRGSGELFGQYRLKYATEWDAQIVEGKWNGLTMSMRMLGGSWTDENGIVYTYVDNEDGTAEITKVESETASKIELPAVINGLQVIAIGRGAFENCPSLADLTIPEGIIHLRTGWGNGIIKGIMSGLILKSLIIPESVSEASLKMAEWADDGVYISNQLIFYGKPPNIENAIGWVSNIYYPAKYVDEWNVFLKTNDISNFADNIPVCMGNSLHIVSSIFNGGTISQTTQMVGWGEMVTITASANEGFVFLGWSGDLAGINTADATISFTMPEQDVILVPNFFPKALIQGWIAETVAEALEKKVDGVNLLTASQAEAATAVAIEAQTPVLKAAGVAEALENKDVYTKESIKEMAFGDPLMEVKNDEVSVAISLESTDNLAAGFEGLDLDAAVLEKDQNAKGLFRVRVPIESDAAFFKFVVRDETESH